MGQDIAIEDTGNDWYSTWYGCGTGLGPQYLVCQIPWTYFYSWIKNCNTVISLAGDEPSEEHKHGAGIAYAMRAMFYMDLASMFAQNHMLKIKCRDGSDGVGIDFCLGSDFKSPCFQ